MLKRYILLFISSASFSMAQYVGTFFNLEPSIPKMVMEPYERKVCGTTLDKSSVDFSKATYTLMEVRSPIESAAIRTLFGYDRINVYGDDYVYIQDPASPCFTGTYLAGVDKVMTDGLSYSDSCYQWRVESIKGRDVICGIAGVKKKVILVSKSLSEQEDLVREYCPAAVDLLGGIDETKALDCAMLLDFREVLGKTSSNPNNVNF